MKNLGNKLHQSCMEMIYYFTTSAKLTALWNENKKVNVGAY